MGLGSKAHCSTGRQINRVSLRQKAVLAASAKSRREDFGLGCLALVKCASPLTTGLDPPRQDPRNTSASSSNLPEATDRAHWDLPLSTVARTAPLDLSNPTCTPFFVNNIWPRELEKFTKDPSGPVLMAVVAPRAPSISNHSRLPSVASTHATLVNGQSQHPVPSTTAGTPKPVMSSAAMAKKSKGKKVADPNETSKLLAAKISQLEQDAAGEKDQEAEIEREVKKATRDLNQLLNNIESPMTRLETVHKKYTELLADMKKLDRDYAKSKKRADQLQKDQDKGKSELNKTATMKDKLEKLCRELTKENKKVKDENKKLEDTEKKARTIVNERLDSLLYDIQDVMASKGNPRNEKMDIDLDEALRAKIKTIGEKFEMRELHYKALLRSKDAEIQSLTAKYEEQRRTADNEAARCRALSSQVSTFSHTEAELRSQLNIYVEKFKQVEDTLNNSNELFLTFRKEMEEMSKKTKRLEKENLTLTRKHDQTNRNILEMAEERTRNHEELEKWRKKSNHLEALCRRMQEQGRGQALAGELDGDDEGTESEYDEDYEDEEDDEVISDEEEYELDNGDHEILEHHHEKPVFGPPPPPNLAEARANGTKPMLNGISH
ncbi:alpha-taxilin, putative [Paecilomyces variotii No. 5]|uniref:Alpha-taxilin, putative n=1 Tax=Byssochlamys spectabilis (strain No. 5 / NBRC 109023) TaxID=1356009 RepID=V5FFR8_BYSSN|nr:alpha-taxilin, putative [Paecilomyces variotii No. 5]